MMGRRFAALRQGIQNRPVLSSALPLAAGAGLGQLVALGTLPLLSRAYPPAAFARLALFQGAVNLLAPFACLKYDLAIPVLPQQEAAQLAAAGRLLPLLLALPLLPLAIWGGEALPLRWLWAVVLLCGLHGVATAICLRLGREKAVGRAAFWKNAVASLLPLVWRGQGMGLVWGQLLGWLAAVVLLLWNSRGFGPAIPVGQRLRALYRHRGYPATLLAGAVSAGGVFSLADYGIAALYSQQQLGSWSMALRLLGAPIALLVTPASQAYFKTAAAQYRAGEGIPCFWPTLRLFALLGGLGYGLCALFAGPLVQLLLGPGWEAVPQYLRLLAPLMALRFVVTPVSFTPIVLGKNRLLMVWQCSLLLLTAAGLGAAWLWQLPFSGFVLLFGGLLGGGYLVFLSLCTHLIPKEGSHGPAGVSGTG